MCEMLFLALEEQVNSYKEFSFLDASLSVWTCQRGTQEV